MGFEAGQDISAFIRRWLDSLASKVDHKGVTKQIYSEIEISFGYFMLLSIANLIALSGLLLNSLPVIIGAMLISPLMGPILGFGYAFVTGDKIMFQKTIRKISLSIAITVIVAAIATYISPIKDITSEIAARTRPNLYDLIIAFLSGTAGAVASCTRRGYVTIVPGVAIATAVIPPLSVAGFGLGIWNYQIVLGSLLLFFTNFVAITISTGIVFYIYGFKPSIVTETEVAAFKKRAAVMGIILLIISMPLIYTLQSTVKTARIRVGLYNSLKRELEKERKAKITTFSFAEGKDDILELFATVNTEGYIIDSDIDTIESVIGDEMSRHVRLYVDQVLVHPRGLKELPESLLKPAGKTQKSTIEDLSKSREATVEVIRRVNAKLQKIITPFSITDFSIGYSDKTALILVSIKIIKDEPLSAVERNILERVVSEDLSMPVSLSVETIPFVRPLIFGSGQTEIQDGMKKLMEPVREAFAKSTDLLVNIEAIYPYSESPKRGLADSKQRIKNLTEYLIGDYGIADDRIKSKAVRAKGASAPAVSLTVGIKGGQDADTGDLR